MAPGLAQKCTAFSLSYALGSTIHKQGIFEALGLSKPTRSLEVCLGALLCLGPPMLSRTSARHRRTQVSRQDYCCVGTQGISSPTDTSVCLEIRNRSLLNMVRDSLMHQGSLLAHTFGKASPLGPRVAHTGSPLPTGMNPAW